MSATSSGHSESVNSTIVGGVEVSASFMNEEIRDLVVSSGLRHGWRPPSTGFFPAAGRAATPQMLQLPLRSGSGGGSGSAQIQMKEKKPCFDGKGIRFEIGVSHTSLRLSAVDIPMASRPTHKYCFLRYRFFDQSEFQESSVFFPKQRTGGCDLGGAYNHIKASGVTLFPHQRCICIVGPTCLNMLGENTEIYYTCTCVHVCYHCCLPSSLL